jgi:hypothetical protein
MDTGLAFKTATSPLDQMIYSATGYDEHLLREFVLWIKKNVRGPISGPDGDNSPEEHSLATLSKLKPGQVLFDAQSRRMGNTTLRSMDTFRVRIDEVFSDHVIASWNGNRPIRYWRKEIVKWRISNPYVVKQRFGHSVIIMRLARKLEAMTAKAAGLLRELSGELVVVTQAEDTHS